VPEDDCLFLAVPWYSQYILGWFFIDLDVAPLQHVPSFFLTEHVPIVESTVEEAGKCFQYSE
jgi:hypothetical protein